ncbi:MAG: hypothetical protein GXP55_10470 [Deltaproteobacteria bacterium]|nr:hypothetical protein [Deltaproteobacteria bacterium]
MKRHLDVTEASDQPLGRDTIMDPALAAKHGSLYVRLACFAIDVDRVRELTEVDPDGVWPFGWEVFLTEVWLLATLDPENEEAHRALLEDVCLNIFDLGPGEPPLGAQIPFAVHDAISRGEWPESLRSIFASWKGEPTQLEAELAPLFDEPDVEAADLALACLEAPLDLPVAPPTRHALEAMVESLEETRGSETAPNETGSSGGS